ncbi:MAG TPA: CGNR zinc finger domain-containing protein [Thermomicrobiales bacterium]|nr:CGNR zinc finger domain-containing protein [Thermomicrobiales bacterium]
MASRFPTIAGHPALDLLNTVHWRLEPGKQTDDIASYADIVIWSEMAGFVNGAEGDVLRDLAAVEPEKAAHAWEAFVTLREVAYAAIVSRSVSATDALLSAWRAATDRARLVPAADCWEWADRKISLTTPQDRVVRSLVALMQSDQVRLLHQCEDDACGWVYLDTSPRRNRRWCIASDCGDRNRAREYYRRQRQMSSG